MESAHPLHPYLLRIRRRLRLQSGWRLLQRVLPWAAALALLIMLVGRVLPVENLRWWAAIPLGLWPVVVIGYTLSHRFSLMQAAQRADRLLGLKERLSTSLALRSAQETPVFTSFAPELVDSAHADALHAARQIEPQRAFPLRTEPRPLQIAAGLLALALLLAFLPNPMDAVLAERRAVAEEARRQAEAVEELQQSIAAAEELTAEEREELLRQLAELAERLRQNNGSRDQALSDLSRLEEDLRQRIDPQGSQRQAALEAIAAQLQAMAGQQNPQIGDLDAAAEALEQLAEQLENLTAEQRQQLAEQLAQMAARAAQAGDSSLAQSLAGLSQAAQSGDTQKAQSAAQSAAEALDQAQRELAVQRARSQALSQLQRSRQSIAGAGRQGDPSQASNQPGQNGQGQGQGQNQGQGQGQGQTQGGGGGTNSDQLPPATSSGAAGDPQGQGQQTGSSDLQDHVFIQPERQGVDGEDIFVPGQDTNQGETTTTERPDPLGGVNNPVLVPFQQIFQQYRASANQALDESTIPAGMKDYIREYFSQLEP